MFCNLTRPACVVWSEAALARVRQLNSLSFHLDLERRKRAEVASVWRWVSSPYSRHLKVTVATLSSNTTTAVTRRNTSSTRLENIFRPNSRSLSSR